MSARRGRRPLRGGGLHIDTMRPGGGRRGVAPGDGRAIARVGAGDAPLAASPAGASAKEAIVLDIEVLEGVRPRGRPEISFLSRWRCRRPRRRDLRCRRPVCSLMIIRGARGPSNARSSRASASFEIAARLSRLGARGAAAFRRPALARLVRASAFARVPSLSPPWRRPRRAWTTRGVASGTRRSTRPRRRSASARRRRERRLRPAARRGRVERKALSVGAIIQRDYKELEARVGTKSIVNLDTGEGLVKCKETGVILRDSAGYLDHINGKKQQRALGLSMRVERSTVDQVKARLETKKREREEETRDAADSSARRRRGARRSAPGTEGGACERRRRRRGRSGGGGGGRRRGGGGGGKRWKTTREARRMDPEMAAMMGFSGSGEAPSDFLADERPDEDPRRGYTRSRTRKHNAWVYE